MKSTWRTWAVAGLLCGAMGLGACVSAGPAGAGRAGDLRDQAALRRAAQADAAREAVNAKLTERLVSLDLYQVAFQAALDRLAEAVGVPIVPAWGSMEALGITKPTEVTLRLGNVPARVALVSLLEKAAGRPDLLDYAVEEGAIVVSTAGELAARTRVAIYDVRDILAALGEYERDLAAGFAGRPELAYASTRPVSRRLPLGGATDAT